MADTFRERRTAQLWDGTSRPDIQRALHRNAFSPVREAAPRTQPAPVCADTGANMQVMAKDPPKRPATYQDLLDLREHVVGEIIDGELVVSPRPASPHAMATSVLGVDLGGPFMRGHGGGPGGWVLIDEPELHIVGQVMVPDLAGWRRE